ncbi:MAG: hypothetical protein BGO29_08740 [Bacteroidales bacterium 36-12]|nr:MAG: hypothetical protein BGO29_08740 [Bacteroidales bacterium 36-12]
MKRIFTYLLIISALNIGAQEITVDGNQADWADVPIISEPGVFPYGKVYVTSDSVYYMIEVEDEDGKRLDAGVSNYFVGHIDADNDKETGQNHWIYPNAGIDYMLTNTMHFWSGSMVWKWYPLDTFGTKLVAEAGFEKTKLLTIPDQPEAAQIPLESTFGFGFRYKVGGTDLYLPANNWDFAYRKLFTVKPRTVISINNSEVASLTSSNAYYMPFINDQNIDEYLDFQSGGYSTQNPQHWASWAINLETPGKYDIALTHKSEDGGKIQFFLVDIATNETVFETISDIWYATHKDNFEEKALTTLDLSEVPAGKYMLKIKNPTTWGAFLKVKGIALTHELYTNIHSTQDDNNAIVYVDNGKLHVKTNHHTDIAIYSVSGQSIAEHKSINTLNVQLHNGIYIVKITTAEKVISHKVTIR